MTYIFAIWRVHGADDLLEGGQFGLVKGRAEVEE